MAAEHRSTLDKIVDTVLDGSAETTSQVTTNRMSGFATRLRSWVSSFGKWIPGQIRTKDSLKPSSRLAHESVARLKEEVYGLYEGLHNTAQTFAWVNSAGEYIELLREEPQVVLILQKVETEKRSLVNVGLLEGGLLSKRHRSAFISLTPQGDISPQVEIRRDSFESLRHVEPGPYSPTISLEDLRTLAIEVQPLQEIRVIREMKNLTQL
jgi:hypothetical protein